MGASRVRGSLAHVNVPSPAGLTRGSIFFVRSFVVHQGIIDGDWARESRYSEARGQLVARREERREKMSMRPFGRLFSGQRNPREHLDARKGAFDDTMRALLQNGGSRVAKERLQSLSF